MASSKSQRDAPLRIDLPDAKADRLVSSKVGIVAVVGFFLGVLWPRVLGVRVGPEVPSDTRPAARAESSGGPAASADSSSSLPASAQASAGKEPDKLRTQRVVVEDGQVVDCRRKKGEDPVTDCGPLKVDNLLLPKLAALASCPSAIGLDGNVSVGFVIDFEKSTVDVQEADKSKPPSKLPSSTIRGILKCVTDELAGIELDKIPHTYSRYRLRYDVSFFPPGKEIPQAATGAEQPDEPKSDGLGHARVTFEKGLVRKAPKDGDVVARLAQGTRVELLEKQGDWYRVKSGSQEGWLYRQAIGK